MHQKIIFHIDMDSFFASCEQQRNPGLRGKPVAVCGDPAGRSVIAAASREAKIYGVRSAMRIPEALQLCSHLILVKGNGEYYRKISRKARAVFEKYGTAMEVASIDEVFLEASRTVPRNGGLAQTIRQCKRDLRGAVGEYITCSIGVAWNKTLAKLASDMAKPDGSMLITPEYFERILATVKLSDFAGIGPATAAKLQRCNIRTPADLKTTSTQRLRLLFGMQGEWLWALARGLTSSDVRRTIDRPSSQSVGHSETFTYDLTPGECDAPLAAISEEVSRRSRQMERVGTKLTLTVRWRDFRTRAFRADIGIPTDDASEIYRLAQLLFRRHVKAYERIRLLGITLGALVPRVLLSGRLFPQDQRREQLLKAIDTIKNTYGKHAITTALALAHQPDHFDSGITFRPPGNTVSRNLTI